MEGRGERTEGKVLDKPEAIRGGSSFFSERSSPSLVLSCEMYSSGREPLILFLRISPGLLLVSEIETNHEYITH